MHISQGETSLAPIFVTQPSSPLESATFHNRRTGAQSALLADLIDEHAVVSLPRLALMLANPALELDYVDKPLWAGLETERSVKSWPEAAVDFGDISSQFRAAVERLTTPANEGAIGVMFSGGLDSLATLVHSIDVGRATGRSVMALCIDMKDDQGASTAVTCRRLLSDLGLEVALEVIPVESSDLPSPPWDPAGMALDALPQHNMALANLAAERGCSILLTGSGADQYLQANRFILREVFSQYGFHAARRYIADLREWVGGTAVFGELIGAVSPLLPRRAAGAVCNALIYRDAFPAVYPKTLTERYELYAQDHHRRWLEFLQSSRNGRINFAHWTAVAAVVPSTPIRTYSPIPIASPFTESGFAEWAVRLPLSSRYQPDLDCSYFRLKDLVLSLLSEQDRSRLPRRKQTFSTALATARPPEKPANLCRLGVVHPSIVEAMTDDGRLNAQVRAVEEWLAGAIERGFDISEEAE